MKIYKLNSLTTFLFAFLIIGIVVFLPIVLIEALWNSTVAKTYADISIDFWQALILWLIVLVVLNVLGLFKFEFAVERHEALDKELLKNKLKDVRSESSESIENNSNEDKSINK